MKTKRITLPCLALAVALVCAATLTLFSCAKGGTSEETTGDGLPSDAADTVTAPETTSAPETTAKPETTEPITTQTETETETETETVTEAPATEPIVTEAPVPEPQPPVTEAPAPETTAPQPVDPVHPTISSDPDGTLNTHANVAGLSAAQNEFISSTVFVGDSICSGLEIYGVLPDDNVIAATSNSAHDIDRYLMTVGGASYDYITALKLLNPKTVVFFMGMNDTYLSANSYCKNYTDILGKVHAALPSARLYVAAITPVSASCTYTTNDNIDNFNAQIRSTVASLGYGYVDIATVLKGSNNCLLPEYSGGDGIHVPGEAYYKIVKSVCDQIAG